jgi:prolyl-tRNA editing enzyme YbaK/EbsC (Cys-tRNA(Pro) deacylase)
MENLLDKEPVKRVKLFLNQFDPSLSILVLKHSAKTALEASISLNCDVGAIVKSLLFKDEDRFLICLVSGDKRCSLNKLKKILNKENVRMASAKEVKVNTGFSIGGVSPVAHIRNLNILIDRSLGRFENVFAAAGHPNCIFKIKYSLLKKITNASEKEISE